jgi:hypothetical protein
MDRTRIHRALDGELRRVDLSGDERDELVRLEGASSAVADALRDVPGPAFADRVMAALPVEGAPAPRWRPLDAAAAALAWLWRPRPLRVRPAWGVAAFAAFAALLLATAPRPAGEVPARVFVQFRLEAPGAGTVAVAGTFTGWEGGVELHEASPGIWTATVPLEPGVHDYVFVVDGERWIPDPAGYPVDDGFGGTSSRLFVTIPRGDA